MFDIVEMYVFSKTIVKHFSLSFFTERSFVVFIRSSTSNKCNILILSFCGRLITCLKTPEIKLITLKYTTSAYASSSKSRKFNTCTNSLLSRRNTEFLVLRDLSYFLY